MLKSILTAVGLLWATMAGANQDSVTYTGGDAILEIAVKGPSERSGRLIFSDSGEVWDVAGKVSANKITAEVCPHREPCRQPGKLTGVVTPVAVKGSVTLPGSKPVALNLKFAFNYLTRSMEFEDQGKVTTLVSSTLDKAAENKQLDALTLPCGLTERCLTSTRLEANSATRKGYLLHRQELFNVTDAGSGKPVVLTAHAFKALNLVKSGGTWKQESLRDWVVTTPECYNRLSAAINADLIRKGQLWAQAGVPFDEALNDLTFIRYEDALRVWHGPFEASEEYGDGVFTALVKLSELGLCERK